MSPCSYDAEESDNDDDVESMDSDASAPEKEDLLFGLVNEEDKSVSDCDDSEMSGGEDDNNRMKELTPRSLHNQLPAAMRTRARPAAMRPVALRRPPLPVPIPWRCDQWPCRWWEGRRGWRGIL